MKKDRYVVVLLIALASLLLAGSGGKTEAEATGGTAEAASVKTVDFDALLADLPEGRTNQAALDHLAKIVAGCTVKEDSGSVYSCKNSETNEMTKWVRETEPVDLYETLGEVALGEDPKMKAAAVAQSASLFSARGDDWKKANATPAAALRLMKVLRTSGGGLAVKAAAVTVHLANLAGHRDAVIQLVEEHADDNVRKNAYKSMMTYGRLAALPTLQAAAAKGYAQPALDAPRAMYQATDEEKVAICPWAKEYLGDADLNVANAAALDMVWCNGGYIDAMLEEGEKRVAAGQFQKPFSQAFREPCFQFIRGMDKAAEEAHCERVYAFLESVANNDTVADDVRAISLWNIYYQRRDQKTLDLMRKYESHENPEIKKRAREAIKSLVETYKLQ